MIIPKDGDRTWTRDMWRFFQRMDRCINRIMCDKFNKYFADMLIFGNGEYEVTEEDQQKISDLMAGKRP